MSKSTHINFQEISNIFIVGHSGSGKTCLTMNILNKFKFDKLLILTNEDKYLNLNLSTKDILLTNEVDSFPQPCELEQETKTIVIFDNVEFCKDKNKCKELIEQYIQLEYDNLKVICISQKFQHDFIIINNVRNYLYILFKLTPFDRLTFFCNHVSDKEIVNEEKLEEEMKEFKEKTDDAWKKPFGYIPIYNKKIVLDENLLT